MKENGLPQFYGITKSNRDRREIRNTCSSIDSDKRQALETIIFRIMIFQSNWVDIDPYNNKGLINYLKLVIYD